MQLLAVGLNHTTAPVSLREQLALAPDQIGTAVQSARGWFARQGLQRRVVASAPSFFMALEYLKGSDLVAFMPSRLLPCEGVFEIGLPKYPPGYQVVAAHHPNAQNDSFITWVLERVGSRLASTTLVSATSRA